MRSRVLMVGRVCSPHGPGIFGFCSNEGGLFELGAKLGLGIGFGIVDSGVWVSSGVVNWSRADKRRWSWCSVWSNGTSHELPGGRTRGRVVEEAVSSGIERRAQGVAPARQQARVVVRARASGGQQLEGDYSGGCGRRRCALRRKLGCGRRP